MSEKTAVKTARIEPGWRKAKQHEPSSGKAASLQRELEKIESKYGVELTKVEPVGQDGLGQTLGGRSNEYPIRLFERDPYDNVIQMKANAPKELGQKMLTSDDLEWIRRKQEASTAANFEIWANSLFNMRDPAQAELRKKIDPEYYAKREMWIEQRAELEKELAKLSLYGTPQSEKQLKLLYMLSTGEIRAPKGVLYDPRTWDDVAHINDPVSSQTFARGLFSPTSMKVGSSDVRQLPFDYLAGVVNRGAGGRDYITGAGQQRGSFMPSTMALGPVSELPMGETNVRRR